MDVDTFEDLEIRSEPEDDPIAAATQAVEELRSANEAFRTNMEGQLRERDDRIAALELRLNRPPLEQQQGGLSDGQRAFASYLHRGIVTPEETRALSETSNPNGGYLAPPELATEIIRDLVQFSPIRGLASVRTTTQPSVLYPRAVDTDDSNEAQWWVNEGQPVSELDVSFGQLSVTVREIARYVDISNRLLADAPSALTEVRTALAEKFGRTEAYGFLYGTGPSQPEGLMTNAAIEVVDEIASMSATNLVKFFYSLPAVYRSASTWAMSGATLGELRSVTDSIGRPLWQPSLIVGAPETLLGRPVVEFPNLPDVVSGDYSIILGDFSGYRIVDRLDIDVLVDPYTRRTNGQTRIHATRRTGGGVLQPAKFLKIKFTY